MGFKYHMIQCTSPFQILQISLHHMEILKSLVKSDVIEKTVQSAINLSLNMYGSLSNSQWFILQQSLLKFLQGKKTKVSLFLQRNLQLTNGTLVFDNVGPLPYGVEKPGTIRYFDRGEIVNENKIELEGYEDSVESNQMFDDNSQLGFNLYIPQKQNLAFSASVFPSLNIANKDLGNRISCNPQSPNGDNADGKSKFDGKANRRADMKSSAKQELNLLADLLGMGANADGSASAKGNDIKPFKINLFPDSNFDDKNSGSKASASGSNFINIDIDGSAGAKSFESYMNELNLVDDEKAQSKGMDDEEEDLLALMDSAK